ncbi:MAG: ABC transporter permease [Cyanobacteria bacterium P01_A01_bin.17]
MKLIVNNVLAIYRKELRGYFKAPLAFVIASVFWLLAGLFFLFILQSVVEEASQFDVLQSQLSEPGTAIDVPSAILQLFLGIMGSLALVILPILSMGLYAEERKRGTLELLATSPITNWAVALGKLMAVLTFFITLVVPIITLEALTFSSADPPMPLEILLVSHLGLVLLAASILALGLFISSLTDSVILAAILTFAVILLLWILDLLGERLGGPLGGILNHLSLLKHYSTLSQGVLDSSSVVLFLSYVLLGLFLTAQSIDLFRFQRS